MGWYVVEFHTDERMPCLRLFGEIEFPLVQLVSSSLILVKMVLLFKRWVHIVFLLFRA